MKNYKSVEFLSIFKMSSSPAETQSPPYWKRSGDGFVENTAESLPTPLSKFLTPNQNWGTVQQL